MQVSSKWIPSRMQTNEFFGSAYRAWSRLRLDCPSINNKAVARGSPGMAVSLLQVPRPVTRQISSLRTRKPGSVDEMNQRPLICRSSRAPATNLYTHTVHLCSSTHTVQHVALLVVAAKGRRHRRTCSGPPLVTRSSFFPQLLDESAAFRLIPCFTRHLFQLCS